MLTLNQISDMDCARDALGFIDPNLPRNEWVRVGMAAHAAGLSFEDFDEWSSRGESYSAPQCRATWRSFKTGKGITAASLFAKARDYGYTDAKGQLNRPASVLNLVSTSAAPAVSVMQVHAVWSRCTPATGDHPYLVRKQATGACLDGLGVLPFNDALSIGGNRMAGGLVVPAFNQDGELQTLQFIPLAGQKMNLPGHPIGGAMFTVGDLNPDGVVYLVEGIGQALACQQATGNPAVVCFGAGNMAKVAALMLAKFERISLVLVPDTGKEKDAERIAQELRCAVAFMPKGEVTNFDASDLSLRDGFGALAALLQNARKLAQGAGDSEEWPVPTPLPDALPAVARFDPELLPIALRAWVCDIAHRMQCPPDFVAVGAMVGLSSLVGARAVIQPKERDPWQVVPNLWGLVVGRPGVKKSPALGEVLKPIYKLAATEAERHAKAIGEWESERLLAEMGKAERERDAKKLVVKNKEAARALLFQLDELAPAPVARRLIVNDATVEKLGELLEANPMGVLVYRDELYGLLTNLDKQGHEGSRSFYLTGYDGNSSYTFDRIIRGTVHIPNVCIALLGGIQPGRVQEYVRGAVQGGGADDGLLQRFGLAVWPDIDKDYVHVDEYADLLAKDAAWEVYMRLSELQTVDVGEPAIWQFTPEAQALFDEWITELEEGLRVDSLHPAMVSHLSKYRKLIPALALLFASIDTPESGRRVGVTELRRAIDWCVYLRSHAVRLYAAASIPETFGAVSLLGKLQAGRLIDGDGVLLDRFTPRLIASKGWTSLNTPELVRKAADLLADYGYLRAELVRPSIVGGRPSEIYWVHPKLGKA